VPRALFRFFCSVAFVCVKNVIDVLIELFNTLVKSIILYYINVYNSFSNVCLMYA